jgi:multidrug transporter EmrE-like cation transporter
MTLTSLGTIILSVTLSAIGQVCFKIGLNSLNHAGTSLGPVKNIALALLTPGVMAGLGFYVVGTLLWLSALGRMELSQAYPFVSLGFALTTFGGWWLFSDQMSIQRVAGIAVIMVGIALVART